MADIRAVLAAKGKGAGNGKNGSRGQETKITKIPKGGAKGAKTKDKGKGAGLNMSPTLTVNDRKLKTVKSRGDKVDCTYYNSAKGCSKGQTCSFKHSCSVLTAKGRVCEANRSAAEHTGNSYSGQG